MLKIYCRDHHQSNAERLCSECLELLQYVEARLDKCPLGHRKPTCAKCRIHCYKPQMRQQIRAVMRYSGPRMLTSHPILAIAHLVKGRTRN